MTTRKSAQSRADAQECGVAFTHTYSLLVYGCFLFVFHASSSPVCSSWVPFMYCSRVFQALSASRRDRLRDLWPRSVGTWGFVLYVYLCVLADAASKTSMMLYALLCL